MNEEEKKAIKYFYNLRATIDESNMLFDEEINVKHGKETIKQITIILNLIEKLQKENKELMGDSTLKDRTINQINNQLKEKDEIIEKQIKAIDKMARRLTTEYHDKEWVISYYMGE